MDHWLVKSEPSTYSWDDLVRDGGTRWDGVRNYQARNNLGAMKKGDLVLYYHSGAEPGVVGIAKVVKESYRDPTTDDERWVAVDIAPVKPLKSPVPLDVIKKEKRLGNISLIKQGRLSVMPVTKDEYEVILGLGSGKK
ncbi:MAG: EVE domain-containing protein [Candidatus Dadabacteria bacterium]|nr:MAG: EVE domain-containing protein [Candidatus Dadabacteria bacterium]